MIDIENEMIDNITTAIHAVTAYANVLVCSEAYAYEADPNNFPYVTVKETTNTTYTPSLDSSFQEKHANVSYDFNVYSNKTTGRKQECKAILAIIDTFMIGKNFVRVAKDDLSSLCNKSVARMVTRYEAVVGADKTIYRS